MFFNRINNSALVIPFYTEVPTNAVYPHDTERMRYDKDDHRYYLTEAGLSYYGIDFDPDKAKWLARTATTHVYSYITLMAQTNANLMYYRIAKSLFGRHKSAREGRLSVERILATQAEYINDYGDAKKAPKMVVSPETGRIRDQGVNMSEGFWLQDEVLSWLNSNYLTDANAVYNPCEVRWSEY